MMGTVSHVVLLSYDVKGQNYVRFDASSFGRVCISHGTVDGDTWTWNGEHSMNGATRSYRLTRKYSSKNSFEFKDETGENANSMSVITEGKGTRVSPSG